jgi:hypothetical protein
MAPTLTSESASRELSGDSSVLDAVIRLMTAAYEEILDPAMNQDIERYERIRRRLHRPPINRK